MCGEIAQGLLCPEEQTQRGENKKHQDKSSVDKSELPSFNASSDLSYLARRRGAQKKFKYCWCGGGKAESSVHDWVYRKKPRKTDRLYLSWEAFFKGDIKRPPTFCKRRKYRSFTLKQSGYKMLGQGRIKILGRAYRFNQSRAITGLSKRSTFVETPSGMST
jgi:hypothetical protein